jgi:hypothetical protein
MTTAAGTISNALDLAKTSFSNSSTFQTLTETADAADALTRTHLRAFPPPPDQAYWSVNDFGETLPAVFLWQAGGARARTFTDGSKIHGKTGRIVARLFWPVPHRLVQLPTDDPDEVAIQFNNEVGQIIDDLVTMQGTASRLQLEGASWSEARYDYLRLATFSGGLATIDITLDWLQ